MSILLPVTVKDPENMGIVKRQPGERRWEMPAEFPLAGHNGVRVAHDRRNGSDRRKSSASMEDLWVLFSQLPSENPGQNQ